MKVILSKPYPLSEKETLAVDVELNVSAGLYEKLKAGDFLKEPSKKVTKEK